MKSDTKSKMPKAAKKAIETALPQKLQFMASPGADRAGALTDGLGSQRTAGITKNGHGKAVDVSAAKTAYQIKFSALSASSLSSVLSVTRELSRELKHIHESL